MTFPQEARSKNQAPRSPALTVLGAAWVIVKFVLSLGLVFFAALVLWTSKDPLNHPGPLVVAAIVLFLAALPWVVAGRTGRGLEALGMAWVIFKFVLSLGLMSFAALLLWTSKDLLHHPGPLGVAAFLLFLATLPWVVDRRTGRALGLLAVFMSISFAIVAGDIITGSTQFPQVCRGRSAAICEFTNGLHAVGGPWLAASPVILIAFVLLGGGILIACQRRVVRSPWPDA